jgi:hypothetical protein
MICVKDPMTKVAALQIGSSMKRPTHNGIMYPKKKNESMDKYRLLVF